MAIRLDTLLTILLSVFASLLAKSYFDDWIKKRIQKNERDGKGRVIYGWEELGIAFLSSSLAIGMAFGLIYVLDLIVFNRLGFHILSFN
jgi:uncharacterized membrane protein YfcA